MSIQVTSNDPTETLAPQSAQASSQGKSVETPVPGADSAAGQNAAESEPAETEAEKEADENTEPEAQKAEGEADESEKAKPKKKSGTQRLKEKLALEQTRREALEQRLARLESAGGAKETEAAEQKQTAKPVKPRMSDFETVSAYEDAEEAYLEKLTDWKADQRDKTREESAQRSKLESEQKTALQTHYDREKAFAEKTADYLDVIEDADNLKDASPALGALIVESENGPLLMYELAKNKAEYQRINALKPLAAARELGRFEAQLLSKTTETKVETKKTTNAPKPITPVGGKGGPVEKSIYDPTLTPKEYERLRREQMRKAGTG